MLAVLGDSVTTDHISPAGNIKANGPAGKYLADHGVKPADFNSYGSRRGNHEVMVRGTFANVRLRNKLAPGTEGGVTRLLPEGEGMSIFDASVKYAERGTPLIILAGKEYGSGSSRDWAAKGPKLLGVRAVIAESFERIHRSNLVGMGILPLQFEAGQNVESLGLTGEEVYDFPGLTTLLKDKLTNGRTIAVKAASADGKVKTFNATVRIDTPQEIELLRARRHPAVRAPPARRKITRKKQSGYPGCLALGHPGYQKPESRKQYPILDALFASRTIPQNSYPRRFALTARPHSFQIPLINRTFVQGIPCPVGRQPVPSEER